MVNIKRQSDERTVFPQTLYSVEFIKIEGTSVNHKGFEKA